MEDYINLGNDSFISKENYKKMFDEYYKNHPEGISAHVPLTCNGEIIGKVYGAEEKDNNIIINAEIITAEGKRIIDNMMNQKIGVLEKNLKNL